MAGKKRKAVDQLDDEAPMRKKVKKTKNSGIHSPDMCGDQKKKEDEEVKKIFNDLKKRGSLNLEEFSLEMDKLEKKKEEKHFKRQLKLRKKSVDRVNKVWRNMTIDSQFECTHPPNYEYRRRRYVCKSCGSMSCKECFEERWDECGNCRDEKLTCDECSRKHWEFCKRCQRSICEDCLGYVGHGLEEDDFQLFKNCRCVFCKKIYCNECMEATGKRNKKNFWCCSKCMKKKRL